MKVVICTAVGNRQVVGGLDPAIFGTLASFLLG